MRFTIVVDGFVIAGNKINMHVGANRVSSVADDSPNATRDGAGAVGARERHLFCISRCVFASFMGKLQHDVRRVNRMCYFLLQDNV